MQRKNQILPNVIMNSVNKKRPFTIFFSIIVLNPVAFISFYYVESSRFTQLAVSLDRFLGRT